MSAFLELRNQTKSQKITPREWNPSIVKETDNGEKEEMIRQK